MRTCSPSTELAIPWATRYSTVAWRSSWRRPLRRASSTTALAMEWGKCSSRQAARRSISASSFPLKGTTSATRGQAWVRVPVLSKTMVSAFATASRNLPPFTVMCSRPASRIAESTARGIANFSAQEKSTISTDRARVTFRVRAKLNKLPANVKGTNVSAKLDALASVADFICSDRWIISTIWSYRPWPEACFTSRIHSPSSTTVPAYTALPGRLATGTDSPVRDAWLMVASPWATTPSRGMTPPARTTTWSPGLIWPMGVSTSPAGVFSHTRSTWRDRLSAKSATDFFRVQSSSNSPISSRNMTVPAVPKSRRKAEIPMERASSNSTLIRRRPRHRSPLERKGIMCQTTRAMRRGVGKNSVETPFISTLPTSFS